MQRLIDCCLEALDNAGLFDDPVFVELPYTPTIEDLQELTVELHKERSGLATMTADVNDLRRFFIFVE